MTEKHTFFFGAGNAEGDGSQRNLLGGKGVGLHEMTRLGLPVPPGFTISTEVCTYYYSNAKTYPQNLKEQAEAALAKLEKTIGLKFGDPEKPLLVSVRSGARASMPGMMDTILNLGLNDRVAEGIILQAKSRGASESEMGRFTYDSYRRFIAMYSEVVLQINTIFFEEALERKKEIRGVSKDTDLSAEDLRALVKEYKGIVLEQSGEKFPEDPLIQLWGAIGAVFNSWMTARAITYRRLNAIPEDWGTAVNVQAMVFGNMGNDCATGVAFTRDPSTGEKKFFGEFLPNAQGEDVVAGTRTPQPINEQSKNTANNDLQTLEQTMPSVYAELVDVYKRLEQHYKEMQDIEFTIQRGKLFMLQCRTGKRTAAAAIRIAVEMVKEGLIPKKEAIQRIKPEQLDQLLHPMLDPNAKKEKLGKGLPASPGAASGQIVFDPNVAEKWVRELNRKVVLVRTETSPEDIHGMSVAEGILTARGGMTCVAGETKVLTDQGIFSSEEVFNRLEKEEVFRVLSVDSRTMRPVWRNIIAAGKKQENVLTVSVSQTGRVDENILRLTADHKMMVFNNRHLVKKPLEEVLKDEDFINVVSELPSLGETMTSLSLAYVAGALFSDGYINLKETKGSVTFIQKQTPEKAEFIAAVERTFLDAFGVPFSYIRTREVTSILREREINGSVEDQICFRREPAARLSAIRENFVNWIMTLDRTAILHFLAGYVDGDGTYVEESSAVRIQISLSGKRPKILHGLVLACLRIGIVPQITSSRENINLQISEQVDSILAFTHQIQVEIPARMYESKCLSTKGLFGDIVDHVNFMGRVREGIKRNLMFGAEKIRRDILPLCPGKSMREVEAILNSSLRSFQIKKVGDAQKATVYNFEVDATDELDKNFIVFSSRLTPVLVSNSHAAVVARGMGKCCVAGCAELKISYEQKEVMIGSNQLKEGDRITLDGSTGEIFKDQVKTIAPHLDQYFQTLMSWVDEFRKLRVRANADTPQDAKTARNFGAEGVGLCRTEHMFFELERIDAVREMILADSKETREKALMKILPMQKTDFLGIFREMNGLPVTIRLLDPPLHEFLPHSDEEIRELSNKTRVSFDKLKRKAESLKEFNPMLGHRGCRLGISFPEIYTAQVRAVMEAACELQKNENIKVLPEIMVPLVGDWRELKFIKDYVEKESKSVMARYGVQVEYKTGTMIELPRAALTANEIAEHAEFFSFGTNDLTQTTYGLSRDDSGLFLQDYLEAKIYEKDPFVSLDTTGVGKLIEWSIEQGRLRKKSLKIGICGEHGGDPDSIHFCHHVGMDYVSCSPYRVPLARLAAAQAALSGTATGCKSDNT